MLSRRIIARLDIKGPNVVKGVHLEGLRVMGAPRDFALRYAGQGADELFYLDTVASLYGRDNLVHIVEEAAREVFIPLTVGGGVRTLDDFATLLHAGADKVAINTAAVRNPAFIAAAAKIYGSQCVVVSVEAKRKGDAWTVYTENGRQPEGRDAVAWIREAIARGAGEIVVTSIDADGTKRGMDLPLLRAIESVCTVPYVFCGGVGSVAHAVTAFQAVPDLPALALGSALHYNLCTIRALKEELLAKGVPMR